MVEDTTVAGELDENTIQKNLKNLRLHPMKQVHVYLELDIKNKNIYEIELIKSYTNLMFLNISNNFIKDICILNSLPYLVKLDASNNQIDTCLSYSAVKSDIDNENRTSILSHVNLSNNKISLVSNMSSHPFIENLNLSNNVIVSTEGFNSLKFLQILDLSYNAIEVLEGLQALPITHLNLQGNRIKSLNGLTELKLLTVLNIAENQIDNLNCLTDLVGLIQIDARNNLIGNKTRASINTNRNANNNNESIQNNNISDKDYASNTDAHDKFQSDNEIINEHLKCLNNLPFLSNLNLSDNPLSYDVKTYRTEVIFKFSKLFILDGQNITPEETVLGALSLGKGEELGWV